MFLMKRYKIEKSVPRKKIGYDKNQIQMKIFV